MKLQIQTFLATHSPEDAKSLLGIFHKRHPAFPNLLMFSYSQIDSPMKERIVQECRGIILDQSRDWAVVSRPYDKFFNLGEPLAAPIDWPSARVYEKLDGSLMTLYHHVGTWHVASSALPDAGGSVHGYTGVSSFAELFWREWNRLGYTLPTDPGICYMFELMTPHNRVVVPHTQSSIVLHGARELASGQEITPEQATNGWEIVQTHSLASADACLAAANLLPPMEHEGYVACDQHFNRVKIKSPKYVAIAYAKDGYGPRSIINMIRQNEGEEFLSYFPELRPDYDAIHEKYRALLATIREAYAALAAIESQKDFAAQALKSSFSGALFALRNRNTPPEIFLQTATMQSMEKLLGLAPPPP